MPKFSLEKLVSSDRKTVFDIFSNFENYQKLFPQHFPSIRVRSSRENTSVVEEHLILGAKELVIMAKHVTDEPVLHEIFVIGGDAKGTHIKEQFIDHENGTKILIDVDFKFKGMMKISNLFGKDKIEDNYSKIFDDFSKNC
ncbi:MAG: polyketide cyclase [Thaumarchaeota archaeon]|nr:polyketide cyclase [Nitrososphaerota archaeon]MBT5842193.1 polyketide cyclase [Nitrososphaerota archaeon]MBT6468682.1 polyketide cyclase [Nitrososphaerota archaeon]